MVAPGNRGDVSKTAADDGSQRKVLDSGCPRVEAPTFLDIIKSWLLCGWMANKAFFKPDYREVACDTSLKRTGCEPYVQPSRWVQLVRKCRARFRRGVRTGCWDGQGMQPHTLHYYKTESYERNFDRGREYWEDLPIIEHPLDDSLEWESAHRIPLSPSVPDPVWMITASQEEIKEKAAAIAKARRGDE